MVRSASPRGVVLVTVAVLTAAAALTSCSDTAGTPAGGAAAEASRARTSDGPDRTATRPRLRRERAPAAAGVRVAVRVLRTDRPGGRITGMSLSGVAVGVQGRPGQGAGDSGAEQAVRWDGDRPVALPAARPGPPPVIGAGGLIAFTAPQDRASLPTTARPSSSLTTAETADGTRPEQAGASTLSVVDVDATGRVLLSVEPRDRLDPRGDITSVSPGALWSPATGRFTALPLTAGLLLDDGGVVGERLTGAAGPGTAPGWTPALWRENGSVVDLAVPRAWVAEPRAGNGGVIVGKVTRVVPKTPPGKQPAAAVEWREGRIAYLPPLGGRQSIAVAVNAQGVIAGTSQTSDGWPRAVVWRGGRVEDLGGLADVGESWATGVSDTGVVAGFATTAAGTRHAVAWVNGGIVDLGAAAAAALRQPGARSKADGVVGDRVYGTVTGNDDIERPAIWTLSRE